MDPFVNEFRRGVAREAHGVRYQFGAAAWLASERTLVPRETLGFRLRIGGRGKYGYRFRHGPGRCHSGFRWINGPGPFALWLPQR